MKTVLLATMLALAGCSDNVRSDQARQLDQSLAKLDADTAYLTRGVELVTQGSQIVTDCQRVDAKTWDAKHCDSRRKEWIADQEKYEASKPN